MSPDLPDILYRDERLILFDKPPGLLSVPGIGPEKADCLASRVTEAMPGARIVHRLDRDTSGIILMAMDAEAHRSLSIQFQDRVVHKVYQALASGHPAENEGVIDLPMRKDLDHPPRQIIDHVHGRSAQTRWSVLDRGSDWTRFELRPVTGRSHQLRLHLQQIGHPILGDDLYASGEMAGSASRLCLHACQLGFIHPSTAEWMEHASDCPF